MGDSFKEESQLIETEIAENSQCQDETSTSKQPEVQYAERESILAALGAVEKVTRARECPRCLNIYAQKIGCNYVRCPNLRCNTWFCWECGKKDVDWTHFAGECKPSFDDVLKGLYVVKFVLFIGGFTTLFITPSVFLGLFVFAPLSITLGTPAYTLNRIMKKWVRRDESDRQEIDVARKALFTAIYILLFIALLPLGAALAVVALLPITLFWFIYLALLWIKLIPIFGQVMLIFELAESISGFFGYGDWLGTYKRSVEGKRLERALEREHRRKNRLRRLKTP